MHSTPNAGDYPEAGAYTSDDEAPTVESREVQSFVIRLWLEEGETDDTFIWRGRVMHVPSGDIIYVQRWRDITRFMQKHVRTLSIKPPVNLEAGTRIGRWLRWLRARFMY